ncbi:MAG TPA: hypothetical protein VFS40_05880 [Gemmatimonadales bacterium]|nr:hypothetical protein [Gemmatimonadales bacterium]
MTPTRRRVRCRRPWSALALGLLVLAGIGGCGDQSFPSAPDAPQAAADVTPAATVPVVGTASSGDALAGGLLGGLVGGLLTCNALPAAHAEAVIGPEGGTLVVGPHTFTVPAGALADTVRIVADAPSEQVASVRFAPEGLRFAAGRPARLTLSYAHCPLLTPLLPKRIAYTDDSLRILEVLGSLDEPLARRVSGDIAHFSRYAVAW